MVVDDSAVVRGLVSRWLAEAPDIEVVSLQRNGRAAVEAIDETNPDIVILDIEMPEMDGMTALPLILRKKPGIPVVVASTLTRRNAEISLKALSLGARDYLPKPEGQHGLVSADDFRQQLLAKIRALGMPRPGLPRKTQAAQVSVPTPARPDVAITLRPASSVRPRVLVIGSSTGGPPALTRLMEELGGKLGGIPVLITQHMPPTFTGILAEHIAKASGRPAAEGRDGEPIVAGRIYVAPGGHHMLVQGGAEPRIRLDDGPPVNFCRPAVDPLFSSAAAVYGPATLALVLTGMGQDGANGARSIATAGGTVLAQDEATSVVWGMPGATARAGVCSAVLPLDQIAGRVSQLLMGLRT
jgi:two-component system chemotaxis response regulator CheB